MDKLKKAERIWYDTWVDMGKEDAGTCTLGNCIETPYGKVKSPPVQGNMSKYASAHKAIEFLQENGIPAEYYDGRMD